MSTNDDENKEEVLDEAEDLLRDAKYSEVEEETPAENDTEQTEESEEEGDQIAAESEQSEFTKKFDNIKGDTPQEYARNLEIAYENSTAEFQKLRQQPAPIPKVEEQEESEAPATNWTDLYAQQKLQEEADKAYTDLSKDYPQAADQQSTQYAQFVKEVDTLSRTILASQGRLAPPAELYNKAAVILGWERNQPTDEDKLKSKLKEDGSTSKNPSATRKPSQSKVNDDEIKMYKKLNPTSEKTDAEIRTELEAYK